MNAKQLTRGLFYVLGAVAALALMFLITEFTIRNWNEMRNIVLALVIGLAVAGLFRLGYWAFSPDPVSNYKNPPKRWTAPDYYQPSAMHLSDGRSCSPHYENNKFIGNYPHVPYNNETIGDYTWSKQDNGIWMWTRKGF